MAKRALTSQSGLLLVDKPRGPASFAVVREVRRRLHERRVGHAGTLDPLASGLLPILVGEATKLEPWLHDLEKVYRATVRLGSATDTYDAEGSTIATVEPARVAALDEATVRRALAGFVGAIQQRPPAYSAIKRDGQRLYDLARSGEAVVVEAREVHVYAIALDRFQAPDLELTIRCGKGTYIRSIAHDLGGALGVHGHLAALRRTRIGPFDVSDAVDVFVAGELPALRSPAEALAHLPAVRVEAEVEAALRRGRQEWLAALPRDANAPTLRLLAPDGRLIAVAEDDGSHYTLGRVFADDARSAESGV